MLVTGYNDGTSEVSVTYDAACSAADHIGYAGSLGSVSTLTFSRQTCALGATGTAAIRLDPGSQFFLIVGNDGAAEGSYGLDGDGLERAEDASLASCSLPQELAQRCDP